MKPMRVFQSGLYVKITAARAVKGRTQFRIRRRGKQRDDAVEEKNENQRRTGHARRDAGQHEDARANHRADADHRDVQQPHFAAQPDF